MHRTVAIAVALLAAFASLPRTAAAQRRHCTVICTPALRLRTGLARSHLLGGARVRSLKTGDVSRLPTRTNLQIQLLASARTTLPRTSVYASMQWLPGANAQDNPFTAYTAGELGSSIRANVPSLSFGAAFDVVAAPQTKGVAALTAYAGDLFSRAARPGDRAEYTHKLDVGATAVLAPFTMATKRGWIRNVKAYATFDWVATGLPRPGDEVPKGERVFLDDVRGASLLAGISVPLAPLAPRG